MNSGDNTADLLMLVLFFGVMYFIPAITANWRKHQNAGAISVLNLLLGWTLIGWVISLVWACTNNQAKA
jgi:hypothetical protein